MTKFNASLSCIMEERSNGNARASAIQTIRELLICGCRGIIWMKSADSMKDLASILSQAISQSKTYIHPHAIIGGNVNTMGLNLLNDVVDFSCKV